MAWLYYSDRLLEFPLGVFGIALATVVLPHLSEAHYKTGEEQFKKTLTWALQIALLIAVPATVGLFVLAQPILATLFQYGNFTTHDTTMSAFSLMAYSLGLPAFVLIKILASGFYARQDTKTPVRIGIQAMLLNMLLNVVFVWSMIEVNFEATHVGLALATSASAYFNAWMLSRKLKQETVISVSHDLSLILLRVLVACAVMAGLIMMLLPDIAQWPQWFWYERLGELLLLIVPAVLCYAVMLWIMGLRKNHLVL